MTACIWNNWRTSPQGKRTLISYDH
jgi:hypothetical protein